MNVPGFWKLRVMHVARIFKIRRGFNSQNTVRQHFVTPSPQKLLRILETVLTVLNIKVKNNT